MKFILSFVLLLAFFAFSCKSPTAPSNNGSISLSLEQAASTEAWLKLTASDVTLPVNLMIRSGNTILFNSNVSSSDSFIYIDSLLPNRSYLLQGFFTTNNIQQTTNKVTFTTMDTTSNNFTWQTFTFGGNAGSCNLYDVAIVNDTLAYAVGSIYLTDSTGQPDPNAYNLVKWNGENWKLLRTQFYTFCNQSSTGSYPTQAVIAISDTEIWTSSYTEVAVSSNSKEFRIICTPVQISKMFSFNNTVYTVGKNGNIGLYSNGAWQKIESGTTADINDIWGININGNIKVYCAVSDFLQVSEHKILTVTGGNKVDSVRWDVGREIHSIWTETGFPIYTAGDGVFENKLGYWEEEKQVSAFYSRNIRGSALNDIYVCGDYGFFAHYNGIRWTVFKNLYINGAYLSIAIKDNLVIAVGYLSNEQAVIIVGRRN